MCRKMMSKSNRKEYNCRYNLEHSTEKKDKHHFYYLNHKDSITKKIEEWRKNNIDKIRLQRRNYIIDLREQTIFKLGSKCMKCGESDWRCLQIDHINGGGTKESKDIGSHGIYRKIIKNGIKGYQLLCANCNWRKKFDNNEFKKRID